MSAGYASSEKKVFLRYELLRKNKCLFTFLLDHILRGLSVGDNSILWFDFVQQTTDYCKANICGSTLNCVWAN